MSAQLTLGVLEYAKERDIRVPEDLSVISYDYSLPLQSTTALTTVSQPYLEKGQHAARSLIALLQGEEADSVTLETRLMVRDSTAKSTAYGDVCQGKFGGLSPAPLVLQ